MAEKTSASSPGYEFAEEYIYRLTLQLLQERATKIPRGRDYITIEVSGDELYANIGRHIEGTVFKASFGNDPVEMEKEYGKYEGYDSNSSTRFFLSINRTRNLPAGVLRVICNSTNGFKTINDVNQEPFCLNTEEIKKKHNIVCWDEVWDLGTLAVLPEHRNNSGQCSIQMYRAIYIASLKHGIKHWISIIDDTPYRMFTEFLGIPFVPLNESGPMSYLGSEISHAVYTHVPDFFDSLEKQINKTSNPFARKILENLFNGVEDPFISLLK